MLLRYQVLVLALAAAECTRADETDLALPQGRGGRSGPARGIVSGARLEIEQLAAGRVGRRGAMIGTMSSVAGAGAVAGGPTGAGAFVDQPGGGGGPGRVGADRAWRA